ncbi:MULTISPECIES: hypothetical protein [unclassified Sphingomonas]|uniref:hypothetical protein n=1 Tax=unclassified Sphingomonas TaxID=196159 RepID=UPI0006FC5092|nr:MULTISPECIES: hypothetical protein [unclassified Sphingomonas]KQX18700.1 hypothetical protein ASD17_16390 [Sphingomonas sp. Root1294]KQY71976.1 hypothetical protein ASD39_18590 [Sphingomonas sp. Root50]KRB94758.1 hypothetical protein ASE22_02170 [Sphingomonas sp. Root720]
MTTDNNLPHGFEPFADLAARWARPTEGERSLIRWAASKQDFADFYSAFMPRLDDALRLLAGYPLEGLEGPPRNLFELVCAFAEAAPHHELYGGSAAVPHSFSAQRFVPAHRDRPSISPEIR